MKKWMFIVLPLSVAVTAIITWFTCLYLFERPVFDGSVEQKSIHSPSLGELRDYLVHLPESYRSKPDQRYPVIYVLDGSSQDLHTAASAALMARIGVTPEVIVVGIPNISGQGRQRDYTPPGMRQDIDDNDSPDGEADKFLAFMRNELIAEIDKSYRTSPSRLIAGNSRGGLFVLYALMADPTLFNTYIANSPALWRDNDRVVEQFDRFLQNNRSTKSALFLSLGSDENDKMRGAFQRTITVLESRAPATLRWHSQFTAGAKHGNNAELATPVALRWAFDSEWVPARTSIESSP
jgi:predicted alpha/beta superfamily hydrolase